MAMAFLSSGSRMLARRVLAQSATRSMSGVPLSEVDGTIAANIDHQAPKLGDVQVTTIANGVTVVSEANSSPTSKVTVVVAAGSRNEGVENAGVSHVMRELAFQSANDRSSLAMKRHNDSMGALVSCTSDREVISYSARFLKKDFEKVMGNLSAATANQAFKSWEVADQKAHIAEYLGNTPSRPLVLDALHAGAFRSTLGNSTAVAPFKIGDITVDTVKDYFDQYFTAGNMTVVGAGVDHDELVSMVEENFAHVEAKDVPATSAEYFGGYESRISSGKGEADVAVAYQGVARGAEDQFAALVLEQVVGGKESVKYGKSGVETLNFNYSDTGLFGVYVSAEGEATGTAVSNAVNHLKSVLGGAFTDADVARAKNQVMVRVMDMSPTERADFYANQVLVTKQPLTPEAFADNVAAVSTEAVKAVAAKIGSSKPVVSSAGNVAYVPYASELGL